MLGFFPYDVHGGRSSFSLCCIPLWKDNTFDLSVLLLVALWVTITVAMNSLVYVSVKLLTLTGMELFVPQHQAREFFIYILDINLCEFSFNSVNCVFRFAQVI